MSATERPSADAPPTGVLGHILSVPLWLEAYDPDDLRGDLVAGLTVAVILIPQSMAYALLAGVPPIYGLYASLLPLLVYPLFGTSMHLAVGVIAIDMILVSAGLSRLAEPGTATYVEMAILLALMVGVIQIGMGLARMGFLVHLLSRPVIAGFTSGAALIIVVTQLESIFGLVPAETQHALAHAWDFLGRLEEVRLAPTILSLASLVLILTIHRLRPVWPAALIVVVLGGLVVWALGLQDAGVAVVGGVEGSLPSLRFPNMGLSTLRDLVPTAVALALIQFMTVVSLGRVFGSRGKYEIQPNRELLAVGAANLAGSLFRGLPVSGSFSRTAVNAGAGARSPLSNVVAAISVGLAILFLTPLLAELPVPVLAAIIVVAALGLLDMDELRRLYRVKRRDGGIALLTFLITVGVGVQEGILTGIAASVVAIMYRISRPNMAVLGHLPGTRSFRDLIWSPEARTFEGVRILRVDASFSFANADLVKDMILTLTEGDDPPVKAVILDASSVNDLDTTAASALAAVKEGLQRRGVRLYLGGVKEPVMETIKRADLYDKLGADTFFLSPHRALKRALGDLDETGELGRYLDRVPTDHREEAEEPETPSGPTTGPLI